jgi:hypothetical protein
MKLRNNFGEGNFISCFPLFLFIYFIFPNFCRVSARIFFFAPINTYLEIIAEEHVSLHERVIYFHPILILFGTR